MTDPSKQDELSVLERVEASRYEGMNDWTVNDCGQIGGFEDEASPETAPRKGQLVKI